MSKKRSSTDCALLLRCARACAMALCFMAVSSRSVDAQGPAEPAPEHRERAAAEPGTVEPYRPEAVIRELQNSAERTGAEPARIPAHRPLLNPNSPVCQLPPCDPATSRPALE